MILSALSIPKPGSIADLLLPFTSWFNRDPRHYQIIFLSIFLFFGIAGLEWDVNSVNILLTFFTCFAVQAIFTSHTTQDYRSLKSAAISALSLCLMLKTNSPLVIVLASVLTISSKFIFTEKNLAVMLNLFQHLVKFRQIPKQVRNDIQLSLPPNLLKEELLPASGRERFPFRELKGSASESVTPIFSRDKMIGTRHDNRVRTKHFFNPTNFGIIVTILLTGNAWISPGQWGSNGLLVFSIGLLGLIVLLRVKRLDTAIAFLVTFCSLSFIRSVLVLGWQPDFFLHQFTSGTLLLFSFFMITDPVSTPSHPHARIAWSVLVALLAFYLTNYEFVNGAPLWALFFLSPLTILLDKLFVHSKFSWSPSNLPEGKAALVQSSRTTKSFVHTKSQSS